MQDRYAIVVLNDGETYADISGSEILIINQEGMDMLEQDTPVYALEQDTIMYSIRMEGADE